MKLDAYLNTYLGTYIKLKDKNTRKITRVGKTSLVFTLPKEMAKGLGWREKQKVVARKVRGGILFRDWKKK